MIRVKTLTQSPSRFTKALSGSPTVPEDVALFRGANTVVLPTLGMIVPKWFLVVPVSHTLNFAQQPSTVRAEAIGYATSLLDAVGDEGDEVLLFEHGASQRGTAVGCGLDHAHIHILVAPSAFLDVAWRAMAADMEEEPASSLDTFQGINADDAYYLARYNSSRLIQQPVKRQAPQRLRRVIAASAGVPEKWDYRLHPFHDNIADTIALVRNRTALAA